MCEKRFISFLNIIRFLIKYMHKTNNPFLCACTSLISQVFACEKEFYRFNAYTSLISEVHA